MSGRVVRDMPEAEYHAHPALSQSRAKRLLPPSCPAKFHAPDPERTDAMEFGKLVHKLALEPGAESGYVPIDGNWSHKEPRDAVAAVRAAGLEPIKPEVMARAKRMAEKLRTHPVAAALLDDGNPEVSLFWTDEVTGVECRARLDWLRNPVEGRRLLIPDLKSARSGSPTEFGRAAKDFGYHMQDAWYRAGAKACGLDDDPAFVFIVQEKTEPFIVSPYELDDDGRAIGELLMRQALETYAQCNATGIWSDYTGGEVRSLPLPHWYVREYEELI